MAEGYRGRRPTLGRKRESRPGQYVVVDLDVEVQPVKRGAAEIVVGIWYPRQIPPFAAPRRPSSDGMGLSFLDSGRSRDFLAVWVKCRVDLC